MKSTGEGHPLGRGNRADAAGEESVHGHYVAWACAKAGTAAIAQTSGAPRERGLHGEGPDHTPEQSSLHAARVFCKCVFTCVCVTLPVFVCA